MFQVEKKYLLDRHGKVLWMLRRKPSHAAHWLAGVYLPPHERLWLGIMFSDYRENNIVASRGTSKSFTHASFASPLYDTLYKNSTTLIVSASGFRGGRLLMEDTDRLFKGQLRSQVLDGDYLQRNVVSNTAKKVLTKAPDMWYIDHKSQSRTLTVPTNNPDSMRGIRATSVIVDERNTFDGEIVQKVIRPMLNVGKEFRKAATGIGKNKMFQVSTIDYTFRDWYPEIVQQNALARREYDAQMALRNCDRAEYLNLMAENDGELEDASFSITRVDYTDLLIPTEVESGDKIYEVVLPRPPGIEESDVKVYDKRDKCSYWYLYPVDKQQLEDPLRNGTMDEDLWMAEQRNVFIAASGNVYPHQLIVSASDKPIYKAGKIPDWETLGDDFYSPVLYNCGDPCVLGLDYARESDEFAIVVIRLGPLATEKFDPTLTKRDSEGRVIVGKTTFSNVIWAESWKHMTAANAADKIRELTMRYNLINVPGVGGGIALDKQGGGSAVRDNLAQPRPPLINGAPDPMWEEPVIIYDPEDEDYAHFFSKDDPLKYWSGLELIKPTNTFNLEATMSSKATLQKRHLYIGRYEPASRWAKKLGLITGMGGVDTGNPMFHAISIGYNGVRRLCSQLVRLQNKVTEAGLMRFVMPGSKELDEGKKDLYSAFIYASYIARKHLVGLTKEGLDKPPTAQPILIQIGQDYKGKGRSKERGTRPRTQLGWGGN